MLAQTAHRLGLGALTLLALSVAGCDDTGRRHPVDGQVLLDAKPLKGVRGTVRFVPDTGKGNTSPHAAAGDLDAEGRYKLSTNGRTGAPAGWYKVIVTAVPPGTSDQDAVKRPVLHSRYADEKSTPLTVEVVSAATPGAYDLKVTRN